MSPLKLLFFIGVSVAMMVSVLGFAVDYPYAKVLEDYEEDAILFDEEVTTIPPPDLLHDIVYGDLYESDSVETFPVDDLIHVEEEVTEAVTKKD